MPAYDGEKYYHRIPGLLVPKSIVDENVHTFINTFIDTIPGMATSLEDHAVGLKPGAVRDYFIDTMETLLGLLKGVYARGLETEASRILRCAKDDNLIATAQKNFKSFITDVLSLSVAMQRAQNPDEAKQNENQVKIESFANMAKSLTAVSNLLNDGFHEPARVLINDLVENNPEATVFVSLLSLVTAGKVDEAKATIEPIREKLNETINTLAGTDFNKTVLAVDDMPEILSFVNNALKSHYKVIAVPGGQAALKVMETQSPSLFLLDIDMPGMDGFELAVRLRQIEGHQKTPLVFLTGNSSREHINNAMQVGGDDFIVKPVTHEYLLTKVGGFLSA